ncbi:hypothetical protein CON15_19510 [Bacillus cereus]|uniref:Uncharacterized protein n=2 Tax=Bacillus TaxID=1386 RepID=A0A9X6U4U3_BACTU|nr:hypothetical protein [Bacillus thuringiensis]PDZ55730.1 hypothetical protein CON15_19510 [Bacillus cereus]PED16398.1 hypothetical protein CON01_00680 [Bacillus thuringiensis]PES54412.1 hypothetical protein CN506_20265 [Bacillus thuringiensis]PFO26194.1 hypothetical protein COJ78_29265 [Bacillus thuringiensis]PFS40350.1 hypothetical protein COK48_00465 [Bacillus thuringiensis]
MKKRILKKKVMRIIHHLSRYTSVPVKTVKEECYEDVENHVKRFEEDLLYVYFDCKSLELMGKYESGWFWKSIGDENWK